MPVVFVVAVVLVVVVMRGTVVRRPVGLRSVRRRGRRA
jgi:hypothetical protein